MGMCICIGRGNDAWVLFYKERNLVTIKSWMGKDTWKNLVLLEASVSLSPYGFVGQKLKIENKLLMECCNNR